MVICTMLTWRHVSIVFGELQVFTLTYFQLMMICAMLTWRLISIIFREAQVFILTHFQLLTMIAAMVTLFLQREVHE